MKLLVIFALALASASAGVYQRNLVVPVAEKEGRITNGKTARVGQFPYQVGLSMQISAYNRKWCGGSLISPTCVLSAAHCVDGISIITVYLGTTVRKSAEITHTVSKDNVTIHPNWNSTTMHNDICVIKIPPVVYSANIQPVKLPAISNSYSDYDDDFVIASGWGLTATGATNNLQYASLNVISNPKCAASYAKGAVTSSNLCCATPDGVSTCSGDSGGPLVLESSDEQVGLVSFGVHGCTLGVPVASTRLTEYLDWINVTAGVAY